MVPSPDPAIFHPTVWKLVRMVPFGTVSTYGQIAAMISPPEHIPEADFKRLAPKWVGEALNAVSFKDIDGQTVVPGVPWWRIINSKGGISMPAGSTAAREQRNRLASEDVTFDVRGLVDLNVFGWNGPDDNWLNDNGFLKPPPLSKPDAPSQLTLL
ncbi:MAG: MGMT family protein [Chloroflexota bacterium]